jgi:hypothetical protein
MENPASNGCSAPAARTDCEVGVAAVELRRECQQGVDTVEKIPELAKSRNIVAVLR